MNNTRQTKAALCKELGIHRTQLDRYLARPDAPRPDKGRRYALAEVTAYIGQQTAPLTNLRDARLREVQLRCLKLERELALAAREVITVAEHAQFVETLCRATKDAMFFGLTSTLPPKLAGLEVTRIRQTLRDFGDAVCQRMIDRAAEFKTDYEAQKAK